MEIYSTLTRSKETFETMNDNRINFHKIPQKKQ